jgi:DNA-binding NarL/FixJ family response regulator
VTTTRILVADDHPVARLGIRVLLQAQPAWEVCGEAATGREVIEKVKQLRPDVVVLGIGAGEPNDLHVIRRIREEAPQTEVLVLSIHYSEKVVREALRAGARGYVLKSDAGADLIAAVEALLQHKPFLTPHASEIVLGEYAGTSDRMHREEPGRSRLTGREREIAQLLAEGKSNKEVAAALGISVKTVEAHRTNIMHKLNLHSFSDLVRYAIRNKIVEP